MAQVRHNCGLAMASNINDLYKMGAGIQHRGREATGLLAMRRDPPYTIDCIKWLGPVDRFAVAALKAMLPEKNYKFYALHTRYATRGRKQSLLEDAHPHIIGGTVYRYDDYVIIHAAEKAMMHNGQVNLADLRQEELTKGLEPTVHEDMLNFGCDTAGLLQYYDRHDIKALFQNIPGAYTLIIADSTKNELLIGRDRLAMRPGVIGERNGNIYMASESCALQEINVFSKETLTPGKIYRFKDGGSYEKERLTPAAGRKMCFFEANYIMSRESNLQHCHIHTLRGNLGVALADAYPHLKAVADYVSFIPNCPAFAASRFASQLDMPLLEIFIKPRDTRAFQGSTMQEREESIKHNLIIPPHVKEKIQGKNIIIIDDSYIRGNNSKRAVQMLREAGVGKIILLSYTPIIGALGADGTRHGCLYGVDMPPDDNFLAHNGERNLTNDEMARIIGADELYFLSVADMLGVFAKVGFPAENLCTHCIGGPRPF